jgi:glycosyltransferase involved in cell wall biosynthesis
MQKSDSFVSVAMVTANDAEIILPTLRQLHSYLRESFVDFEIVIVDQNSRDGTANLIEGELERCTSVRMIELAYPVAFDVAMAAALENAIGDFVVVFSPGQDPISCISALVQQCKAGSDVVVGVATHRDSLVYRIFRPFASKLLEGIGYDLPRNATRLRCLSRRAVNAVTQAGRFHHQLFVRMAKTGYPLSAFVYEQLGPRDRRRLASRVRDVLRLLVFNSTKPLRWMGVLGVTMGFAVLLLASHNLTSEVVKKGHIDSSALILLFFSFMFLTIFIMLAFFGEYLGRLLDDHGEQFTYSVVYEKNSSVMLDVNRVNVLNESEAREPVLVQTDRNH